MWEGYGVVAEASDRHVFSNHFARPLADHAVQKGLALLGGDPSRWCQPGDGLAVRRCRRQARATDTIFLNQTVLYSWEMNKSLMLIIQGLVTLLQFQFSGNTGNTPNTAQLHPIRRQQYI